MKKMLTVLLPLFLIVVMSSLSASSSGAAGPEAKPAGRESREITVYMDRLNLTGNGAEMTVDPIEWYTGKEAADVFAKYEPDAGIDGPPDGYYIVNEKEERELLPVAKDAEVRLQIYDRTGNPEDLDISWNESIELPELIAMFQRRDVLDLSQFPYHLTIENGRVVRIVQQYVP